MKKMLYKSDDKKLDGVCAGIAEYFDIDPTVVRAGYAFVSIVTGLVPGVIAYIVLAVIMPANSNSKNRVHVDSKVKKTKDQS